jgi:Abortive infection C-terminus
VLGDPFGVEPEDLAALDGLEQVERLKNCLMARATGSVIDSGEYQTLRRVLRNDPAVYAKLPAFVRTCSDLSQFWNFIQKTFPSYQERREFLWQAFAPAIEYLEAKQTSPGMAPVGQMLAQFNAEEVHAAWEKALTRRNDDPEGAITAARTLVETVCKHILDDAGIPYSPTDDLPKLWHRTAKVLNLAPSQHQDELFKAILGNCQTIVDRLAAIRNTVGDAHGQGRQAVKPTPRHAELAINLAGSMAAFLVATWLEQNETGELT